MNQLMKQDEMISVIEKVALNPDVDVDKMERLLQMQERILERNAEAEFNNAMVNAQTNMPIIKKDAENKQTNSMYAKLETVTRVVMPIITQEGFAVSFGTDDPPHEGFIRVVCDVSHRGGHSKRYHYDLPMDDSGIKGTTNKTKVHASASSLSYGQRYLLKLIFNLIIEGLDDDGNRAGGDFRSALDILNEWVEYQECVRENFASIYGVKMALADKDYSRAKEAWREIPQEEQKMIWKAPSKGGIFETAENNQMRSNEWHNAE